MYIFEDLSRGVTNLLLVRRLEDEGHGVGLVLGLDGDDVVVGGASQDFAHGAEIHAHRELTVASEFVKAVGPKIDKD